MGASDYMAVQPPNFAAYANPNFGLALGQQIADLPEAYMKGREMKRLRAAQQPIIDPNTGQPSKDPELITEQRLGLGGDYAEKMLPFLYGSKWMRQNAGLQPPSMEGNEPIEPPAPFARGAAAQPAQPSQPQGPTFAETVAKARPNWGPQSVFSLARQMGINPETPLSEEQVQQVNAEIKKAPKPATFDQRFAGLNPAEAASEMGQPAVATSAAEVGNNVGGAGPALAGGSPSGGPAPVSGTAPTALAQAGGGRANVDAAGVAGPVTAATRWDARQRAMPPSQDTGLPSGYTEKTAANWYKYGSQKSSIASGLALTGNKAQAESVKSEADHAFAMAQKIRDAIKERTAFTNEQKNARDVAIPQSEGLKVAQKHELDRGDALQKGLQGAAREFETALKPHLDAMRGILNDPNFVSGTGVGFLEALNKIRSNPLFQGLPGYDPNAALPNEAIRKVIAASILNQTTSLKAEAAEMGGSAGRLFQQQISLMQQAAQNPESTAAALRYLTELQQRMGDHARAVANLASKYDGKYGRGTLDNGFNEVLSQFNSAPKNQIFKPSEIAHPETFAPPIAPVVHNKAEAIAWADKAGIRPGDPIKIASTGRVIPFDPEKFK